MNVSELRAKVFEEVQRTPDDKLAQLYDLIHEFRLGPETFDLPSESIMEFAGCWSDLLDEAYAEFAEDIAIRRQQAFSQRRHREISLD